MLSISIIHTHSTHLYTHCVVCTFFSFLLLFSSLPVVIVAVVVVDNDDDDVVIFLVSLSRTGRTFLSPYLTIYDLTRFILIKMSNQPIGKHLKHKYTYQA